MTTRSSSVARPHRATDPGFHAWHVFVLMSAIGAAAVVWVARNPQPLALLLLSGAVLAAGLVGLAFQGALAAFAGGGEEPRDLGDHKREALEHEKALVLRSIKELEFDHATGKLGEADFKDMLSRLRTRALALMEALEPPAAPATPPSPPMVSPDVPAPVESPRGYYCTQCGTQNDADAKFCKNCGHEMRR